jgi:hypothetical protein
VLGGAGPHRHSREHGVAGTYPVFDMPAIRVSS